MIWHLDETFWSGTLSEGGVDYSRANHEIVVTLVQRGILSSIGSKNEMTWVRALLESHQISDYFVFPSID